MQLKIFAYFIICLIILIIFGIFFFDKKKNVTIKNKDEIIKSPRVIKNLGNSLVCESLREITKNPIIQNYRFEKFIVDCYDSKNEIALDYLPEAFYKYNLGNIMYHSNLDEFYFRIANQQLKKKFLKEKGIIYLEIPFTEDTCINKECSTNERKSKINQFLRSSI